MPHHRHFILHKPYGYLSQFVNNQNHRRNKKLLGSLHDFPPGIMSIGRLDENSEGLLLLTTNGIVSAQINSRKVEKEYYVQLDGEITEAALEQLREGVNISTRGSVYTTLAGKAMRLDPAPNFAGGSQKRRDDIHGPTSWASITIKEGKFRQVRKMTAAVGFPTLRLIRVRVGHLQLSNLMAGEAVEVDDFGFTNIGA
jgi:23S rRNA pseudouridine2457 synthase